MSGRKRLLKHGDYIILNDGFNTFVKVATVGVFDGVLHVWDGEGNCYKGRTIKGALI